MTGNDCRSADEVFFDHLKRNPDTWNDVLRLARGTLRNTGGIDGEAADFIEYALASEFDDEVERGLTVRREDVSFWHVANMIIEEVRNDPAMRFKTYLLDCCRDETVAMVARETDDTIRRIALDLKRKYKAILSVTGTEPEEIDFESVAYDVLTETVRLAKADQAGARAAAEADEGEAEGEYDAAGRAYTEWLARQSERMAALVETVHAGLQDGIADGQIAWMLAHKMKADFEGHVLEIEAEADGDLSDLDAALVGMDSNEIDFYQIAMETVRQVRSSMPDSGEEGVAFLTSRNAGKEGL